MQMVKTKARSLPPPRLCKGLLCPWWGGDQGHSGLRGWGRAREGPVPGGRGRQGGCTTQCLLPFSITRLFYEIDIVTI